MNINTEHRLSGWRYRVFDSLSFPTVVLDTDRNIVSANLRFQSEFGVTESELAGRKCYECFEDQSRPCFTSNCPVQKVITEKTGASILRKVRMKTGDVYWEERVFSPILNDNNEVTHIIESIRDVSRIKFLEKQLYNITDLMQRVIQSSVSAIVVATRSGQILIMNGAAESLFGYSMESLNNVMKTRGVEALYPPGVARELMQKLRSSDYGGKGKLSSTQVDIINARGQAIPVRMTAAIIYDDGREVSTMGIYNDLRERLEAERKLNEIQKRVIQSEKMASLGQLAAGVAHEINNPLTGIFLYANMLRERLAADDANREDLEFIIEDAERCKEIVKNLLVYSRQTSPRQEVLQINDLVEQSLSLIRDQEIFLNIVIVRELASENMHLRGDKNQLCQVLINLILNAVDAMERKGTLTLKTYRDGFRKKVYLEVRDTGCGIPEAHVSKVFDPFFSTKEQGKGTGLGLSTVYGIVQENGGSVAIKQTGPQGTTFIVEFPLISSECSEAAPGSIG